jgi:ligand-binding sensor domain-containing protein
LSILQIETIKLIFVELICFIFMVKKLFHVVMPVLTKRKLETYHIPMKSKTLIAFLYLSIFTFTAYSQESREIMFEHISSENFKVERGLSQNSVNCIWQDHRGYLWFGTWDGLNRYDGYSFSVYKSTAETSEKALSNQTVNAVYEDKHGTLWIGTETGLDRYDRKNQKFIYYWHNPNDIKTISSDSILCFSEDKKGNLWIGTRNGLNCYDYSTGNFVKYTLNPDNANSLSSNTIISIASDQNEKLYIGTDKGLNILNIKTGVFTHIYGNPSDQKALSDDKVNALSFDQKGKLWIGTDQGLDVLDNIKNEITHYKHDPGNQNSLSYNQIFAILTDTEGNIWIGTNGGGLNLYNSTLNNFTRYQYNTNDNNSISNDYISCLYQDNSGIIWIGTAWKGVNKINRNIEKFYHYEHIKDNPNSLSSNIVWSVFQDENDVIWVGTEDGINIIDRKSNTFKFIQHIPGNNNSLVSSQARGLFKDSKGNFWIGTFGYGLDRYNPETGEFIHYKNDPFDIHSLSNNTVWNIIEDRRGYIWFATLDGLNRFDYQSGKFTVFKNTPNYKYSLSDNSVLSLFEDHNGFIWISTYKGINVYDYRSGRFLHYRHEAGNSYSLSSDYVFSVYEAKDGIMWIATMGGGLNRFDRRTGLFTKYTEDDGLSNNVVYNIYEDKSGKLWISTNYGLTRFDPATESFVNYDAKDGIQSNEFNLGAAFHNKLTDEMFFGGMNGFNAFIPEKVKSNTYVPPVVISTFRIFDKIQPRELINGDTIELSYYDNFFSFEFSALDFTNPAKNHYAYKLENFDKDWNYCDAYKRFAGYTNVTPGTYIFHVKGSNSDGIWNDEGISVVIVISPAWWSTWWFRISTVLFLTFILWYIIYNRLRTIKRKHDDEKRILEIEKQMFSLEQTALRLQINPHFIFNSLNSIQSFVIANDTDLAINYLAKFAQLMRLILSNSYQSFIPIADELKALRYYLDIERLRFSNKFDFSFIIDPIIDTDFMEIPPMIIQPYIENAILHGILNKKEKGHIKIEMIVKGNSLLCIVEDDGIGREKAAEIKAKSDLQHKSRGMLITQKRLELLNKQNKEQMSVDIIDLKDSNGYATGTRVELMILYQEL